MTVSKDEILKTVERMEDRLRHSSNPTTQELMFLYRDLKKRFATDLKDERDKALCASGALMLIQAVDQNSKLKDTNLK